jgi:hypothetical protein
LLSDFRWFYGGTAEIIRPASACEIYLLYLQQVLGLVVIPLLDNLDPEYILMEDGSKVQRTYKASKTTCRTTNWLSN